MNGESNNYKVRHTYIRISAGQIITICCWTDILCLSKLNSSTLHGRTQYKGDQASAKLDLTFINVDLTCQTVIIGPDMYMYVHVHTYIYLESNPIHSDGYPSSHRIYIQEGNQIQWTIYKI